jgi:hypothetical protein
MLNHSCYTDFSGTGVSFILGQKQKAEDKTERLIAACGRSLTQGEKNYSPAKGELTAGYSGFQKFEMILRSGVPVVWRTDQKAWLGLFNMRDPKGRWARMKDFLATFTFTIQHRPGKEHINADCISHIKNLPAPSRRDVLDSEEFINQLSTITGDVHDTLDEGVRQEEPNYIDTDLEQLIKDEEEANQEVGEMVPSPVEPDLPSGDENEPDHEQDQSSEEGDVQDLLSSDSDDADPASPSWLNSEEEEDESEQQVINTEAMTIPLTNKCLRELQSNDPILG